MKSTSDLFLTLRVFLGPVSRRSRLPRKRAENKNKTRNTDILLKNVFQNSFNAHSNKWQPKYQLNYVQLTIQNTYLSPDYLFSKNTSRIRRVSTEDLASGSTFIVR